MSLLEQVNQGLAQAAEDLFAAARHCPDQYRAILNATRCLSGGQPAAAAAFLHTVATAQGRTDVLDTLGNLV